MSPHPQQNGKLSVLIYRGSNVQYATGVMSPSTMAPISSAKHDAFLLSLIIAVIELGIAPLNRPDDS